MLSPKLALLTLGVVGLAYFLWTPLPDKLEKKAILRIGAVIKKTFGPMEWIGRVFLGHTNPYQMMRAYISFFTTTPLAFDSDPQLQVSDDVFNGVLVRVYRPQSAPVPSPVLMHFHGGGWSIGSIDWEDAASRYLAKEANVVVISVEYRLAPEHPFPGALDDCLAATVHVLTHGLDLGLDTSRVGVTGLSAGGNLAAAVPLRLLDPEFQKLPSLRYQILLAPCLQGMDLNLPSYIENDPLTGSAVLSRQDMARFYLSYSGLDITPENIEQVSKGQHIRDETKSKLAKYIHPDLLVKEKPISTSNGNRGSVNKTLASLAEPVMLNYLLSPLVASDDLLKRVPRAMVVTSRYDVLRDDGLLYVRRLRHAGVDVTSHMIENGHHASMFLRESKPGTEGTVEAYQKVLNFIKES